MEKQSFSLDTSPDVRPFREILNHGSELDNALERFPYDKPKSEEAKVILRCFGEWIREHWMSGRLCFAEIMFFRHSGGVFGDKNLADPKQARAFIMAPKRRTVEAYAKLLDDFFAKGHALTMNADFQKKGVSFRDNKDWVNGYLLHNMSKYATRRKKQKTTGQNEQRTSVRATRIATLPHDLSVNPSSSVHSEETLLERWRIWCDNFKKQRDVFISSEGQRLGWLAAVPIGYRNPKDADDFRFIAAVFFGGDEQLSEDEVKDFLRYIALQIFEQNISILHWANAHPNESELWRDDRMDWFSSTPTSSVPHSYGGAGFETSERELLNFVEEWTGRKMARLPENLFYTIKTLVGAMAMCHHPRGRDKPSIGVVVLLLAIASRKLRRQKGGNRDWFTAFDWAEMGDADINIAKNQADARKSIRALMNLFDVLVPHKQSGEECTVETVEWKSDVGALEIYLNINCMARNPKRPNRHPLWRTVSVGDATIEMGETASRFLEAKRYNSQLHFCLRPNPANPDKSILLIYCIEPS